MEYIAEVIARMTAPESEFSVKSPPKKIKTISILSGFPSILDLTNLNYKRLEK